MAPASPTGGPSLRPPLRLPALLPASTKVWSVLSNFVDLNLFPPFSQHRLPPNVLCAAGGAVLRRHRQRPGRRSGALQSAALRHRPVAAHGRRPPFRFE